MTDGTTRTTADVGRTPPGAAERDPGSREPRPAPGEPDEAAAGRAPLLAERAAELGAALRSLEASEALYRSLVDTTGTGYAIVDAAGRVVDANPEYVRLAGRRELGEILGRSVLEWTAAGDRQRNAEALARCAREGRVRNLEVEYVDPLGATTPVEINATVVEKDGEPRIVSLCRDITERRRTEERLIQAQVELMRGEKLAVLGQLSASLAHELRNPLGVIQNAVYYLATVPPDAGPKVKEYLDIILAEVGNSRRIIADLLEFSRTRSAEPQRVSLAAVLRESVAACAVPGGVEVVEDLPEPLPELSVDPLQLRQVFQNLVTNAVQAMPRGGRITLRAVPLSALGAIDVAVEDTGEGISPEHLARLFQPLFTTKARGIGLGLTVVKRNVEANGGTISVASAPGKGTTFTVRLPVVR